MGNGLRKICQEPKAYGLPEPEFIEMPETFRVNLYRKPAVGGRPSFDEKVFPDISASGTASETDTNTKTDTKAGIKTDIKTRTGTKNGSAEGLLRLIRGNPSITLVEMAEKTGLSKSGVRYALGKMREQGLLERIGTRKKGKWTLR